ncbi:hypothetical protein Unana1_00585 [Umbelopsis nana]
MNNDQQTPKPMKIMIWVLIISCSLLNAMAVVDIVLTARAHTETLDHCKEMQFDPLTNQSVVSDDLCMLKWGLAMTAVAISVLINLALDIVFIHMLRRISKEASHKFIFPYDDPEKPLHFRTQRLRDTIKQGDTRPPNPAYALDDRQLSQSSIADILTSGQTTYKTA